MGAEVSWGVGPGYYGYYDPWYPGYGYGRPYWGYGRRHSRWRGAGDYDEGDMNGDDPMVTAGDGYYDDSSYGGGGDYEGGGGSGWKDGGCFRGKMGQHQLAVVLKLLIILLIIMAILVITYIVVQAVIGLRRCHKSSRFSHHD